MSENGEKQFNLEECEKLISKVRDVVSARIVVDSDAVIREIHLLAGSGRSPKQIVRDIESIFMTQYGVNIDHKKISIAQLDGEEEKNPAWKRLRFLGLSFATNGPKAEVRVNLQYGDDAVCGVFTGPRSKSNSLRLIASATLGAVEQCIHSECFFTVEDVTVARVGRYEVVNVAISLLTAGEEDLFIGAALIKGDERDAVARAVLSALNRRFPYIVDNPHNAKTVDS